MICALLLGREGSRGFPGKNTAPVLGRPLMAYPLLAARHARLVDQTYVSTDSPQIRAIGVEYGASIIERPLALATPEALGEEAYRHGFLYLRDVLKLPIELMVLLFCNAATILARTIDEGIEVLRKDPALDSAVTVSCYNMWSPLRARRIAEDGLLHPFIPLESFGDPSTLNCDRDSQGAVFFADMSASIVRPRCLEDLKNGLLPQRWMGRRIHPLKQWGGCDVDYTWQVPGVEYWLRQHGFTEERTPYNQPQMRSSFGSPSRTWRTA